jgi:hypothetical protein
MNRAQVERLQRLAGPEAMAGWLMTAHWSTVRLAPTVWTKCWEDWENWEDWEDLENRAVPEAAGSGMVIAGSCSLTVPGRFPIPQSM